MRELRALVDAARRLRSSGEPFLVSTVVALNGSAYRGLGARMLSTAERWEAGSVSGGCLERDVLRKGFWQTSETRAVLVHHDETSDERSGSGCLGRVDLLIERAPSPLAAGSARHVACDPLALAERCLRDETVAVVATVFRSRRPSVKLADRMALVAGERLASFDDTQLEHELALRLEAALGQDSEGDSARPFVSADGSVEALIEVILPPPHLFVFGAAHDAAALVSLAQAVGFSTTVCTERALDRSARERLRGKERVYVGTLAEAVALLNRCARPLAMVMGHHYERDRAVLAALSGSAARYLGVLGPAQRTQRMLEDLFASGALSALAVQSLQANRLHAPAGLDLGSRTPAEVALSILAEIQSVLRGTSPQNLRTKTEPIHGRARGDERSDV